MGGGQTCRDVGRLAKTKLISVKTVENFNSWQKLKCQRVNCDFEFLFLFANNLYDRWNANSAIVGTDDNCYHHHHGNQVNGCTDVDVDGRGGCVDANGDIVDFDDEAGDEVLMVQ